MCFSAPASFAVSALLLPLGAYTLSYAVRHDKRFVALASFPLFFGLQQLFEGWLWTVLAQSGLDEPELRLPALGFLFFAYLFWPFFVPFAASQVEERAGRRYSFVGFCFIGLLFGSSLYLPLWMHADWLSIQVVKHSILYDPILIYDGIVPRAGIRVFYAFIVAVPLLLTTQPALRTFGVLILLSVVVSAIFFVYAFVSIWCFFAALLSLYVFRVLHAGVRSSSIAATRRKRIDRLPPSR